MAANEFGITQEQRLAFGDALHEAMTLRAMNQATLAAMLDTTQSVISQWRYGKFQIQPRAVFAIEEALGLPPGWLSRHLGYYPPPAQTKEEYFDVEMAIHRHPVLTDADKMTLIASFEHTLALRQELAGRDGATPPKRKPTPRTSPAKPKAAVGKSKAAPKPKAPRRTALAAAVGDDT